jgi:hypothetical protein
MAYYAALGYNITCAWFVENPCDNDDRISSIKFRNRDVSDWNCAGTATRRADNSLISIDYHQKDLARTSLWHIYHSS